MDIAQEKWIEIFSQGDIWELRVIGNELRAFLTGNDHSDYEIEELVDNGISTVNERAKSMGLKLVVIDFEGKEID